jgi:hypothetical protein
MIKSRLSTTIPMFSMLFIQLKIVLIKKLLLFCRPDENVLSKSIYN